MSLPRSKKLALIGAALVALALASVAIAAWMASGTGPGKGKSGLRALTVNQSGGDPATLLVPGGSSQLGMRVTNPNSRPVLVTSVTGTGTITSDDEVACRGSLYVTFTNQTGLAPDNIVVPAGGSQEVFVDGLGMSSGAPDGCQNRTFTVPVRVDAAVQ